MRERLTIDEVAKLIRVTPKTVRHYEKVGVMEEPERTEADYLLYYADEPEKMASKLRRRWPEHERTVPVRAPARAGLLPTRSHRDGNPLP